MTKPDPKLTETELSKALDALTAAGKDTDPNARKTTLLAKAANGGLTPAENDELVKSLQAGSSLAASATAPLRQPTEEMQKSFNVSPFLAEQHTSLCKSLDNLSGHIDARDEKQHGFNLALAKSVVEIGGLVKSMAETMGAIAKQPARGPMSAGVNAPGGAAPKPLQKSFGGGNGTGANREQLLDGLEALQLKKGAASACGEDLTKAISKLEGTGEISQQLRAEVEAFMGAGA